MRSHFFFFLTMDRTKRDSCRSLPFRITRALPRSFCSEVWRMSPDQPSAMCMEITGAAGSSASRRSTTSYVALLSANARSDASRHSLLPSRMWVGFPSFSTRATASDSLLPPGGNPSQGASMVTQPTAQTASDKTLYRLSAMRCIDCNLVCGIRRLHRTAHTTRGRNDLKHAATCECRTTHTTCARNTDAIRFVVTNVRLAEVLHWEVRSKVSRITDSNGYPYCGAGARHLLVAK